MVVVISLMIAKDRRWIIMQLLVINVKYICDVELSFGGKLKEEMLLLFSFLITIKIISSNK